MSSGLKKFYRYVLAAVLLVGVYLFQESLNRDRDRLELTRVPPLENAPPVLAFTTVALGGFRGLISNALWIRANDLQDQDKFFEMAQLADWITKLEPHFVQVWLVQAWNMAYNISVKFSDYADRWRWIQRGITLLRDDGLRFNPNETLVYRELAWFFQHKLGANLDDGNMYFKQQWANEMAQVFGKQTPNLDELIHPQTSDQTNRARLLIERYKMDPAFMKEVDARYGPLEWRLPEASAIYWAAAGLRKAEQNPSRIKQDDLITLRRVIYQSMLLSFQRGRLIPNPFEKFFEFGPNLDIVPKVSAAYEQSAEEDAPNRDHILKAHRNFLRDAVYFLYVNDRMADAAYWYKYLGRKYPNQFLIDGDTNSFPANVTLDEYAVGKVQEDVTDDLDRNRIKSAIEGLIKKAFHSYAIGQDERAAGYMLLAQKVRTTYESKTKTRAQALAISSIEDIKGQILKWMLDPDTGFPLEYRAALRKKLDLEDEKPPPPTVTNSVPQKILGR